MFTLITVIVFIHSAARDIGDLDFPHTWGGGGAVRPPLPPPPHVWGKSRSPMSLAAEWMNTMTVIRVEMNECSINRF